MYRNVTPVYSRYPAIVWGMMLAAIFSVEYVVMLALPVVLPEPRSRLLDAVFDAVILTAVVAPLIWWTVVRPARAHEQLRARFLAELFSRLEAERRRNALELHDGVGQQLSVLVSGLRSSLETEPGNERLKNLLANSQGALQDVKRLARGMRPSILDDLGIRPAIERMMSDVHETQPLDVNLDLVNFGDCRLPEAVETTVYRIVQEAMANVVSHAHAHHVGVCISRDADGLHIQVQDDGKGIDLTRVSESDPGCLGLRGMRERAALMNGIMTIATRPGNGTRIDVFIPLSKNDD